MMRHSLIFAVPLIVGLQLCLGAVQDATPGDPVVRTPLGAVRGTTMTSRDGRTIYAFRGMRYAKPPVGELRFKPPVPATESWNGINNATEDGASCPQPDSAFLSGPKSEDCLFLNVYTTRLPNGETNPKYPVIVYIHHGGWFALSGQSSLTNPRYLMDEDVVFVAINYRLGALGFLSTGDSEIPGNNGLKDQLLALKWIRDNIESFGGDPHLVTIYGCSAGAAAVQYHMASTRSSGLFHRAISSSGSALSPWVNTKNPMKTARRQAKLLNCPNAESATSRQIADCLRGKDAEEIAKSLYDLRESQYNPQILFAPVIEAEGSPDQPFLTEDPDMLFQTGNFTQVPWMIGTTNNEWMRGASGIVNNETVLEDFAQNFEQILPTIFNYEKGTNLSLKKSRKLKEFYFPEGVTKDSLQPITDLYTDAIFLYGADRSAKLFSSVSRSPVYYYQYVYRGRFGNMPNETGSDKPPGAAHLDDLIYIFHLQKLFPFIENDFPEAVFSKMLVKLWANFARTGNPTPNQDDLIKTRWTPHTPTELSFMEIGDELVMKHALRQERVAVWEEIYQKQ